MIGTAVSFPEAMIDKQATALALAGTLGALVAVVFEGYKGLRHSVAALFVGFLCGFYLAPWASEVVGLSSKGAKGAAFAFGLVSWGLIGGVLVLSNRFSVKPWGMIMKAMGRDRDD